MTPTMHIETCFHEMKEQRETTHAPEWLIVISMLSVTAPWSNLSPPHCKSQMNCPERKKLWFSTIVLSWWLFVFTPSFKNSHICSNSQTQIEKKWKRSDKQIFSGLRFALLIKADKVRITVKNFAPWGNQGSLSPHTQSMKQYLQLHWLPPKKYVTLLLGYTVDSEWNMISRQKAEQNTDLLDSWLGVLSLA